MIPWGVAGRQKGLWRERERCPEKMQKGKLECTRGCQGASGDTAGTHGDSSTAGWGALGMQWGRGDAQRDIAALERTYGRTVQIGQHRTGGASRDSRAALGDAAGMAGTYGAGGMHWRWGDAWRGVQHRQQGCTGVRKCTGGGGDAAMPAGLHWGMQQVRRGCSGTEQQVRRG